MNMRKWFSPSSVVLSLALTSTIASAQFPREVLSNEALNARAWALAALETAVPPDIRKNLTLLREALLDEGKSASASPASAPSYMAGALLCDALISTLDERDQAAVRAGYRAAQAEANTRVTNQSLDAHAPFRSSWPQYARIKDQRAEIQRQQDNKTALAREQVKVDWSTRSAILGKGLDELYQSYREALRQDPDVQNMGVAPQKLAGEKPIPPSAPNPSAPPVATPAMPVIEGARPEVQDLLTSAFAALPEDNRFKRVVEKLKELNPGFTGEVVCKKKGGAIGEIQISGGLLTDLWPLRTIPFQSLRCHQGGDVSDLSPLKGMPLTALFLPGCTHLSDLSALKGMPLRKLFVNGTQVRDLTPLRGMQVDMLAIQGSAVTDYSPLSDMPNLRGLQCDFVVERDRAILRAISTLERINNLPVKEFWERVDAGELPRSGDYKENKKKRK